MTGLRKPSEFCWINMLTPQPADSGGYLRIDLRVRAKADCVPGAADPPGELKILTDDVFTESADFVDSGAK